MLANNRFSNDEFEDIFSNSKKDDHFEDIYSSSNDENGEYEDFSSYSQNGVQNQYNNYNYNRNVSNNDFNVRYNSAVQNRRRQEIQYGDINDVYANMAPEPKKERKRKKHHPIRNTFLVLLCLLVIGISCVGFYGYNTVKGIIDSFDTSEPLEENEYVDEDELYSHPEQINILLVGVDAREEDVSSRSDTMMLLTLDNKNGQIKLTSFLRDSYVQIAGGKKEKLNAAYFRGGIQGLADTLEMNFMVEIPYYVIVDFEVFEEIVDKLGGIEVDVTEAESNYTYNSGFVGVPVRIEAGEDVHLDGEEALWYSRIRYLDSDFMRTQRQRKVISAIVEKAKTKSIPELIELAQEIAPLIKTNMESDKIFEYGFNAVIDKAYSYDIVQQQIPAEGTWSSKNISGVGSCLVMDMDENSDILQEFLEDKQDVDDEESKK